jgi:hypothetical protein
MLIYSQGESYAVTVATFPNASKVGRYMAAVGKFLRGNDPIHLKPFIGKSIKDAKGKTHIFETNPNAIYRIAASGGKSFEEIYRIII